MFKHSDKTAFILAADVGGSHMTTGLIRVADMTLAEESVVSRPIRARHAAGKEILADFTTAFNSALEKVKGKDLVGIAIAMPGPFLYETGIFKIKSLDKYGALYGLNFRQFLYDHLEIEPGLPIYLKNDADCFALGAYNQYGKNTAERIIGITLGTGLGSAFIENGIIVDEGELVPPQGKLYNCPLQIAAAKIKQLDRQGPDDHVEPQGTVLKYSIAEDLISSRGILGYVNQKLGLTGGKSFDDVALVAAEARKQPAADNVVAVCREAFALFGQGLATSLKPWLSRFQPGLIILGGGIAKAADLFMPDVEMTIGLSTLPEIVIAQDQQMEALPLIGVASALAEAINTGEIAPARADKAESWRKTHQPVLPKTVKEILKTCPGGLDGNDSDNAYQIYPWTAMGEQKIHAGFSSLAGWIKQQIADKNHIIVLDGYAGVHFRHLQAGLSKALVSTGIKPVWINMDAYTKDQDAIEAMVAPFLGDPCSVWGKKTTLALIDFLDTAAVDKQLTADNLKAMGAEVLIVAGTGAGLIPVKAPLIFVELPKNEIQYRLQAGTADNLYTNKRPVYAQLYKRAYFVDWPVLNAYRSQLGEAITVVADGQWPDTVHWTLYEDLKKGFAQIACNPMRARPWFAPGAWGGDWMKAHIPQLSKEEVNYAWSFELIVPENGLILESDGQLLEVPFDWLMAYQSKQILGKDTQRFGSYFPIRFDFLDTFDGGNLSIQCHPSVSYIQQHFGETVTQDETYYMLDTAPGAGVYLGFQEDIDPADFKHVLMDSQQANKAIDIEQYVQLHPAKKHDLFLIPNQTIHSSGKDNLVLEISATPYIFTFKMYDWVRPDLNGKPRPINIDHAFNNLNFSRKGTQVEKELISHPVLSESTDAFQRWDLPTHKEHYYAIQRLEIKTSTREYTKDQCHIMMVVEGAAVEVLLDNGVRCRYNYAETFIIPASVGTYQLINPSGGLIKVVKSFVK